MRSQTHNISYTPIAFLKSDFGQRFGTPRQGALAPSMRAGLRLEPKWRGKGMFSGLEHFSHVWLLGSLHQVTHRHAPGKVRPPRLEGARMGLFATRSPHRPNSIGLTLARLLEVNG